MIIALSPTFLQVLTWVPSCCHRWFQRCHNRPRNPNSRLCDSVWVLTCSQVQLISSVPAHGRAKWFDPTAIPLDSAFSLSLRCQLKLRQMLPWKLKQWSMSVHSFVSVLLYWSHLSLRKGFEYHMESSMIRMSNKLQWIGIWRYRTHQLWHPHTDYDKGSAPPRLVIMCV